MDWSVWGSNPGGAKFSIPVQTSPGAHPASYTMGTRSFLGVKWPGCGVDHPPPSRTRVKERIELYLYSPLAFMACSKVNFTFQHLPIQPVMPTCPPTWPASLL